MGNDSGGQGAAGRRKKRGWRKGWYKSIPGYHQGDKAPAGSFRFIPTRFDKDK